MKNKLVENELVRCGGREKWWRNLEMVGGRIYFCGVIYPLSQ
jgi:hypothetical protein